MLKALREHHISFKNAFEGLSYAFSSQPNFKIHIFFSCLAVISGILFKISNVEMMIIIFTIVLGMTVEMMNTSIEAVTDLISPKWNMAAKIAKDVAAGMMLLTAIGAVIIAMLIFLPKIIILII